METSRLLKAGAARGLGARVAFNFEDLRRQCDEYIAQTRRQAEQILEHARTESEVLRRQTFDDAAASGRQAGLKSAEEQIRTQAEQLSDAKLADQLRTLLPALQSAAEQLRQERERWLAHWETAAIRLSVAIAGKLLRHELEVRPGTAVEMITEALRLAAGNPQLRVRLHPDDLTLLGSHAEQIVRQLSACAEAHVDGDPSLSRGDCLVETKHGAIDARLETQLQRITNELLES